MLCVCTLVIFIGCATVPETNHVPSIGVGEPSFVSTVAAHADAPLVAGNRIEILFNGDEIFPALLKAIHGAKASITYAQFLYKGGPIAHELAQALAERCRAQVQVKILIDAFGGDDMPADIPALWQKSGCEFRWFRPFRLSQLITPWELLNYDYRNHRRILVIDGKIGFTGGHGVSPAWTGDGRQRGHWRDTDARIEGPVVRQLQAAFVESWRETTGDLLGGDLYFPELEPQGNVHAQIVKSSPFSGGYETYLSLLLSITSAKKSIHITNPYVLPDERLEQALAQVAARGVHVIVLTPGRIDWKLVHRASRRGLGALLRHGIQVYEYQPALLHAKTMVVDGVWAIIGTTNLDNRSFALNEEINLAVRDAGIAGQLERAFEEDLKHSRKLTYEEWKSRPWSEKILELFTLPIKDEL